MSIAGSASDRDDPLKLTFGKPKKLHDDSHEAAREEKKTVGDSSYRFLVEQIMSEARLSDEVDDIPRAQMKGITKQQLKLDLSKLPQSRDIE